MEIRWHQKEGFPAHMPDDEWLTIVGSKDWVVLSQDRKFHVRDNEALAVVQHKVRCFYLPCANETRWVSLEHFIRRYRRIEHLSSSESGPFIYELKGNGQFYRVPL